MKRNILIFLNLFLIIFIATGCKKQSEQNKNDKVHSSVAINDSLVYTFTKEGICWQDSSTSKVYVCSSSENNGNETILYNHTYLRGYPYRYKVKESSTFIVSQNIRWSVGNHEGNMPFLIAKGYLISNNSASGVLWNIQMEADEGRIINDLYQTVLYGCCGASSTYSLFNLLNGTQVVEYTEDLLMVSIPNSHPNLERFIGFKSNNASSSEEYEKYSNDSLYLGTISYASRDSLISKIILRSTGGHEGDFGLGPSLFTFDLLNTKDQVRNHNELELWSANFSNDEKSFNNFSVKVKFDDANDSILIPITEDQLMINNLRARTFSVKRIK